MVILGLDLATSCGWAVLDGEERVASGVWDLSGSRFEGGGMRYLRFRTLLAEVLELQTVTAIAFEEMRAHRSMSKKRRGTGAMNVTAAHVYGGLLATLAAYCDEREIPYRGIPVGTAKKAATGKGNAKKEQMMAAAEARWKFALTGWDDESDALWLAEALRLELRG